MKPCEKPSRAIGRHPPIRPLGATASLGRVDPAPAFGLPSLPSIAPRSAPPPSEGSVALRAELELPRVAPEGGRVHLRMTVVGRLAQKAHANRARPASVWLYVDESASMTGEAFTAASAAAHALVRRLGSSDRLGVVGVGVETDVVRPLQPVGDGVSSHTAIDRLVPGVEAPGERPRVKASRFAAPPLVLYVTDGVGPELPRTRTTNGRLAPVLAFVVGRRARTEDLDALAATPGVELRFVPEPRDLPRAMDHALAMYRAAVARDLELTVKPAPGVRLLQLYGAEHEPDGTGGLRIPSLGPGEARTIIAELDVGPGAAFEPTRLVDVSVAHREGEMGLMARRETTISTIRAADREHALASRQGDVLRSVLAFRTGDVVERAGRAIASGDVPEAKRLLDEQRELLSLSASRLHDASLYEDARVLAAYERVLRWVAPAWDEQARRRVAISMRIDGDGRVR